MSKLEDIIKPIVDRIRALETIQEGNGFVPYLFTPRYGDNAITSHGDHTVLPLTAGDTCYIEIVMPRMTANLSVAELIYIPTGTGTWDYSIYSSGGYCGEDEAAESDFITADGEAVTDDQLTCLDITSVLTPYHVGDIVGVQTICDALDTATQILILGIRLR